MKDDTEFFEIQLRAAIVPQAERWPDDLLHWQSMKTVVVEARQKVRNAFARMDQIDSDRDLSNEGKARKKKRLAAEAIADFQKSKSLRSAKNAVERMLEKWAEKTGLAVKPPANIAEAMIQCEVRAHLAAMKGSRLGFLEKYATDPVVGSAILGAPGFLSGLMDNEVTFVRQKIEQHVAPEVAKARDATLKAMKEVEQGWQTAVDKIGERAGLTKGTDGTWRDRSRSEAA